MKRTILFPLFVASLLVFTPSHGLATEDSDLDTAFANLVAGRSYLVNFPVTKTRARLIQDYLGADTNGVFNGSSEKFLPLSAALDQVVNIRNQADVSPQNSQYAQVIAWESLEGALSGQLYAGNSDLLNALRVAFPVAAGNGTKPPGANRGLPLG